MMNLLFIWVMTFLQCIIVTGLVLLYYRDKTMHEKNFV